MHRTKLFKFVIKIALSIAILSFLLARMDMAELRDMTHHFKASAWGYAALLIMAQFFILSFRWMLLINIGHKRMSFLDSVQVTLASLLANMLFITSLTGIFVRIALALQYGASMFKAVFATAVDRLMTLAALVLFSSLFLPALGNYLEQDLYKNTSLYMGLFIFTVFVCAPLFLFFLLKNLPKLPFSKPHIRSASRYLTILLNNRKLILKVSLSSLAGQMSFFIAVYCIMISGGLELSFLKIMTVLPIISLVASLPLSFGGWGVREGAFVYGLGLLGVPMEMAFLTSVQIGLVSMLVTILVGLPALIMMDTKVLDFKSNKLFALNPFSKNK